MRILIASLALVISVPLVHAQSGAAAWWYMHMRNEEDRGRMVQEYAKESSILGTCVMDSTIPMANDYFVVASRRVAGDCHAQKAAPPRDSLVLGHTAPTGSTIAGTSSVVFKGVPISSKPK